MTTRLWPACILAAVSAVCAAQPTAEMWPLERSKAAMKLSKEPTPEDLAAQKAAIEKALQEDKAAGIKVAEAAAEAWLKRPGVNQLFFFGWLCENVWSDSIYGRDAEKARRQWLIRVLSTYKGMPSEPESQLMERLHWIMRPEDSDYAVYRATVSKLCVAFAKRAADMYRPFGLDEPMFRMGITPEPMQLATAYERGEVSADAVTDTRLVVNRVAESSLQELERSLTIWYAHGPEAGKELQAIMSDGKVDPEVQKKILRTVDVWRAARPEKDYDFDKALALVKDRSLCVTARLTFIEIFASSRQAKAAPALAALVADAKEDLSVRYSALSFFRDVKEQRDKALKAAEAAPERELRDLAADVRKRALQNP
jgi:hypothetical protein